MPPDMIDNRLDLTTQHNYFEWGSSLCLAVTMVYFLYVLIKHRRNTVDKCQPQREMYNFSPLSLTDNIGSYLITVIITAIAVIISFYGNR